MSEPKDKQPKQPPQAQLPPSVGGDKRSGRVGFDERGNSVWEWQLETGVYSRDVSTQKLKKLELGELSIAETAVNKRPEGLGDADKGKQQPRAGGGFNPYDNARSPGRSLQPKASNASESPVRRKPADLQKLGEWLKAKKKAQDAKDREDDED